MYWLRCKFEGLNSAPPLELPPTSLAGLLLIWGACVGSTGGGGATRVLGRRRDPNLLPLINAVGIGDIVRDQQFFHADAIMLGQRAQAFPGQHHMREVIGRRLPRLRIRLVCALRLGFGWISGCRLRSGRGSISATFHRTWLRPGMRSCWPTRMRCG